MFGKAAPWMVYQKEMSACDLGIPLWEPNPPYLLEGPRYKRMEVGDVGVLQGGSFELLFNVFLEKDHPRQGHFGVPQDFKPLRLPGPRGHNTEELFAIAAPLRGALDAMPLKTENVIYHRGSLHGGATPGPVPFNVGAKFEFEFSKESGAVLLFSKPARRYEMGQGDLLEQHVRLNYRSWMGFARDQGYSLYFGQLYIVTGVIRTSQWAMATWKSSSKSFDSKASLSVAGVADTSAAYKGHWSTPNQTIMTNQGPVIDTLGGTDNQTLFFNTIVVRGRGLFPAKIRAAAGPRDLGAGDRDANSAPEVPMQMDEEEDAEIFRIPGNTKDSDVLAPVLDHILDVGSSTLAQLTATQCAKVMPRC
ncbi:hypothetical protein NEOLEDRAFT_635868 [Neolentinus lepideus HHB14362 ss-1]|uniref:Uncharacterized protein n=1 Tax=Neolentinus lepideus HHB14362 ss-1 TaxID=1314782 RepID=A0A165QNA7_9AGAM|nr:hypothetical protein NEOLEDRAFT_635868 [Neolentinus lepideus HHB14362 ss-1]